MPEDTAPQLTEFEVLVEDLILTAVHKVFDASGIDDDVLATVEANADLALDLTGEILQQLIGGAYLAKQAGVDALVPIPGNLTNVEKLICDEIDADIPKAEYAGKPVSARLARRISNKLIDSGIVDAIVAPDAPSPANQPFFRGGVFPPPSPKPIMRPVPPTVGRIVHYTEHPSRPPLAAIITAVDPYVESTYPDEGRAFLHLFDPSAIRNPVPLSRIPFSETPKPYHWSWPPRT
ncbi:hypothetical protein ACKAMS_24790 [Rhodococcus sp. 5A-K4]|uniref:hypothetical protein n=1 Tax=Rhodococcus sp. 5A-K4 TaxID=3384442 RepID=UPI0038D42E97